MLLCLGLDEIKESEGLDRADMKLADNQIELLQAVQQANPNTVVIVSAGASLETPCWPTAGHSSTAPSAARPARAQWSMY